ncbi:MAG: flagellar biosynthetic protein FliQ [Acidobacteriaceae bacterium]
MGPDQVVELGRRLLIEALILSAPILVSAALVSLLLSLLQTLTSVQEQTLTAVPRLVVVAVAALVTLPWFLGRMVGYTEHLWADFHRYLG